MSALEIEVLGAEPNAAFGGDALTAPSVARIERLCALAMASAGVEDGHLAIEFVTTQRMAALNAEHRGKGGPTDVLSFPIDGVEPGTPPIAGGRQSEGLGVAGETPPRELGDIVICPEHTVDICEAIVHGALHLVGMDHETDEGEMLALQAELLRWERTR